MATSKKAATKTAKEKPAKEEAAASTEKGAGEEKAELSTPTSQLPSIFTGGDFEAADIEIPRLNIIQKTSQIEGEVGGVVIDKDSQIIPASTKVPVIVVGANKWWQEDIPYEEEEVPKKAFTKADAAQLEKDSSYKIQETAEIAILIPKHEFADEECFPYPIGDTHFAVGKLTVQKDAYRMTFKRLRTFSLFNRDTPHYMAYWRFSTDLVTKGKYSWFVPTLVSTKEETPKDAIDFILRLHGQEPEED